MFYSATQQRLAIHKQRKDAARRKNAARFKDGNGKTRRLLRNGTG